MLELKGHRRTSVHRVEEEDIEITVLPEEKRRSSDKNNLQ